VNPDTIGYVWTGEYDLNTLRVDGEIFESATKKLRIRKYPYRCGQGLRQCIFLLLAFEASFAFLLASKSSIAVNIMAPFQNV